MLESVSQERFREIIANSDKPVIADFYAEWCGPCKMIAPMVEELANERPDILFIKVNVDQAQELASELGVVSIPTFAAFREGKLIRTLTGAKPKAEILALL